MQAGRIPSSALLQVAAYLAETRRLREVHLVARAIEDALADDNVVVATVTSARPLDQATRQSIKNRAGNGEVYLREVIEPAVLGGIRLQTPDASYDATIAHKLSGLTAAKV